MKITIGKQIVWDNTPDQGADSVRMVSDRLRSVSTVEPQVIAKINHFSAKQYKSVRFAVV